jgi:hypothetical protein
VQTKSAQNATKSQTITPIASFCINLCEWLRNNPGFSPQTGAKGFFPTQFGLF